MIRKVLNNIYQAAGWLSAFFLATICAIVLCQVLLNIADRISSICTGSAIGLTIPSYSDFTGFFLAASSFLALAYTMRAGQHIRVTLLFTNLPPMLQRWAEGWCLLFASSISCYFTYYTAQLVYESYIYNDLSAGMVAIPIWIPQASMLLGLALLSLSLVDDFFCHICGKSVSYNKTIDDFAHSLNE